MHWKKTLFAHAELNYQVKVVNIIMKVTKKKTTLYKHTYYLFLN